MPPNRLKKNIIRIIIGIVVIVIVSSIIMPMQGRYTLEMQLLHRGRLLTEWKGIVEGFESKNGRLPRNLYEACHEDIINNNFRFPLLFAEINDRSRNKNYDLNALSDPNTFARINEFRLFVGDENWFIIERAKGITSDKQKLLLIDQNGTFYLQKVYIQMEREL